MEFPARVAISGATADVKVCCYQYEMPLHLRGFFGLGGVDSRLLSDRVRKSIPVGAVGLARFHVRALLMGWSWSVHLVQQLHLGVFMRAGLCSRFLQDKTPSGALRQGDTVRAFYIDNVEAFSTCQDIAENQRDLLVEALRAEGIVKHEEEERGDELSFLWFVLQPGTRWAPSSKRFWKIALAIRWLLGPGRRRSALQMKKVLGHVAFLCTLRRDFLGILHTCCGFAHQVGDSQSVPLWPSVREELWAAFLALLPLLCAPLELPWNGEAKAVDASLRGFGILEASWGNEICASVGRWKERARFRGIHAAADDPRDRALERAGGVMQPEEAQALAPDSGFPEVPPEHLLTSTWRAVTSRRWKGRSRRILELEGSALVWCVRHLARSTHEHAQRHHSVGQPRACMRPGQGAGRPLRHQCGVSHCRSTRSRHGSSFGHSLDSLGG